MKFMQESKTMLRVSKAVQDHFLNSGEILQRDAL